VVKDNRRPTGARAVTSGARAREVRGSQTTATRAKGVRPAPARPRPASPAGNRQNGSTEPRTPRWLPLAALVLSIIGLGLSCYLTAAHLAGASILVCSSNGLINCEAVTTSPESILFGVFPVSELGLAFYVFMIAMNLPAAWRPAWNWLPRLGPLASPALRRALPVAAWRVRLGAVVLGMLFILYLIYTELITLRAICLWCTYVHITTFLLFATLVAQAALWGSPRTTADA
jgi:uncharacterized membrane protein